MTRVIHFVCRSGMRRCVLGTDQNDFSTPPPCAVCAAQSQRLYANAETRYFDYIEDPALAEELEGLSIPELAAFDFPLELPAQTVGAEAQTVQLPLGRLVMPSMRWALRRHDLPDDAEHRALLRMYLLSAYRVAQATVDLLLDVQPQRVVVFNGIMYPEAAARWVAAQLKVPVITHEVGFQRFSAFFSAGDATAYPIVIPPDFDLDAAQSRRLDAYLEQRFQGQFTMAGIRFWPEMRGLDAAFLDKAAQFRQVVPIFTNVVYDTSQVHANTLFPHMFAWLDLLLEVMRAHPETLFVIRAHPDEMRPNSRKKSRQSVRAWVEQNRVAGAQAALSNVVFIDSQEYVSSYELIGLAKFVIVYNSSIGLEAALLGAPVVCGGAARYTQYPIVFFPESAAALRAQIETFLAAEEIEVPAEFRRQARRFLHYQLERVSLPFDDFIEAGPRQGFVTFKAFDWRKLLPATHVTLRTVVQGILHPQTAAFYLPEAEGTTKKEAFDG